MLGVTNYLDFIVLSRPLWCHCPRCCFTARGYSNGFEQWYRRYCGICISFPWRPVGQPRAVYLSGYKAASQRAQGEGIGTEVGVKGTGCHCVLQQGCEMCKCLRHSWRRLHKSNGCSEFPLHKHNGIQSGRFPCITIYNVCTLLLFFVVVAFLCTHSRQEFKRVGPSALCIRCSCQPLSHLLPLFIPNRFVQPELLFI